MKTGALVFVVVFVLQCLSFYAGYQFRASQEMTLVERRNIAIEYACGPGQNWTMMKFFCGSVK